MMQIECPKCGKVAGYEFDEELIEAEPQLIYCEECEEVVAELVLNPLPSEDQLLKELGY